MSLTELRDKQLLDALRADLLPVGGDHELLIHDAPITVHPIEVLYAMPVDKAADAASQEGQAEEDGLDTPRVTGSAKSEEEGATDIVGS